MAFASVAAALTSPMLTSRFDVVRRTEVDGDDGFATQNNEPLCDVLGVVCSAAGNDLERLSDQQRMGRHISIVTQFQLRGMAQSVNGVNYQPDIVKWLGDYYIVQQLDQYPHFGPGFCQAICGSIDWVDRPTPTRRVVA